MTEFRGKRVSHEYIQANPATPERIFPLLCPVRETDWVPGWEYRLIHSESGFAEANCVFATPNPDGSETTWVVTEFDSAAYRIAFVWVNPGLVAAQILIKLEANPAGMTNTHIGYTYTGLSEEGNREVERYNKKWFLHKMQSWEAAINHYLTSGRRIDTGGWE